MNMFKTIGFSPHFVDGPSNKLILKSFYRCDKLGVSAFLHLLNTVTERILRHVDGALLNYLQVAVTSSGKFFE